MFCPYYFYLDGVIQKEDLSTIGNKVMDTKSTLWLHWNFTLFAREKVTSVACGYGDSTAGKMTALVNRTGSSGFAIVPSIPVDYKERIRIYSSNHTFAIERLMFSDQKSYFCQVKSDLKTSTTGVSKLTVNLDPLNLEVQGKFNIECLM